MTGNTRILIEKTWLIESSGTKRRWPLRRKKIRKKTYISDSHILTFHERLKDSCSTLCRTLYQLIGVLVYWCIWCVSQWTTHIGSMSKRGVCVLKTSWDKPYQVQSFLFVSDYMTSNIYDTIVIVRTSWRKNKTHPLRWTQVAHVKVWELLTFLRNI